MRTGGCSVQQTLTAEATAIIKTALVLARRRGHAQATPLHVAATLLSSDSSLLRRACLQYRNGIPHPGGASASSLQYRALELCFNVALNRLPAVIQGQPASLSNALVAALKRAQAHQRRGCLEQQQHQPLLGVKVEMEQLIISILDDPSVSRVMREAGFCSDHVKNNVEAEALTLTRAAAITSSRLPFTSSASSDSQNIIRHNTAEDRKNYICYHRNQTSQEQETPSDLCFLRQKSVMNNSEFMYSQATRNKDVEFLIRAFMQGTKRKNIVVVGEEDVYTESIVKEAMAYVESGNVPETLKIVRFIVPQFLGFLEEIELRLAELRRIVESCHDHGANCIVYVGDLGWTLENHERGDFRMDSWDRYCYSPVGHIVKELGKLLGRYADRLLLLGTATYQTYLRCNTKRPSLESEWALQTLTVPAGGLSLTLSSSATTQNTKMEGGKGSFPNTPEFQTASSDAEMGNLTCCTKYSDNFEIKAGILGDHKNSVTKFAETEIARNNLLYWLPKHKNEGSSVSASDVYETTGSGERLSDLHKQWYQKCHSIHSRDSRQIHESELRMQRQNLSPSSTVSAVWQEPWFMKQSPENNCITSNSPSWISSIQNQPRPRSTQGPSWTLMGSVHSIENSTRNFIFENNVSERKVEVDTTLALGRSVSSSDNENTISDKLSSAEDIIIRCTNKPSDGFFWKDNPSSPDSMSTSVGNDSFGRNTERFTKFDIESLSKGLEEKVKWQNKITRAIAMTVLRCRSGMARRQGGAVHKRDAWLLFLGPDKMGKRKIGRSLAEIIYGSEHNFSCIEFKNFNSSNPQNQDFLGLRGMKTLERVAEIVRLNPRSVVFLEEVEHADTVVINSLVNAMETGQLLEISISDAIIIMTSSLGREYHTSSASWLDEDRLLAIKEITGIKLLVTAQACVNISPSSCTSKVSIMDCKHHSKISPIKEEEVGKSCPCKRKADCVEEYTAEKRIGKPSAGTLDLNYHGEALENYLDTCSHTNALQDDCYLTAQELSVLHCVRVYFPNNFFKLIDKTFVFQPFDFEALKESLLGEFNRALTRVTGGNGYLQIDRTLMDHFVAASSWQYSDEIFSKWLEAVFMKGLVKLLSVHNFTSETVLKLISVEKMDQSNSFLNSTLPTAVDV